MKPLEDYAFMESVPDWKRSPFIGEALDPSRMVAWYHRMIKELKKRLEMEEGAGGNKQSAEKLRTLLHTFTDPKFRITSSLNIEAFDGLSAATAQYSTDTDWKHYSFIDNLHNSLEQAVAKLEASGMVGNDEPEEAPDYSGGAPGGDFGPQDEPPATPPGEEAPTQDEQGGPEAGAPDDEENDEAPPSPGGGI